MITMFKMIPTIFIGMLMSVAAAAATAGEDSESARIQQAVELYTQAASLEYDAIERTELLNQSESMLLDVIAKNPESLDAHRKLMGVYLQMRNYTKGIQIIQSAITLSPEDPKLFIALAILYDHQGAYEYAVPVLDAALALDPNQQLALDYKAKIQQKIEMQNIAMEAGNQSHAAEAAHHGK
jgi:tetratricopeptide (TPR) repeat protein